MSRMRASPAVKMRSLPRLIATGLLAFSSGRGAEAAVEHLRLAFSHTIFGGVNEHDARASITALVKTISRDRGLAAEPRFFDDLEGAVNAFKRGQTDAISLTAPEFWRLRREIVFDTFFLSVHDGEVAETYFLLTHRDASVTRLADLKGRSLGVLEGPRMSLALAWLDLELAGNAQPGAREFFGRRVTAFKPTQIVLPLFFRQIDAAVVSRRVFRTMVELNPQLARELQVKASSPPLVPTLFAIVTGTRPELMERMVGEFARLHLTPAGQQALTIFQTGLIRSHPEADLRASMALLDAHAELRSTPSPPFSIP